MKTRTAYTLVYGCLQRHGRTLQLLPPLTLPVFHEPLGHGYHVQDESLDLLVFDSSLDGLFGRVADQLLFLWDHFGRIENHPSPAGSLLGYALRNRVQES